MSRTDLTGRRLGGYVVEREIGAGGMGLVVLARQESLERPAVLKRMHPDLVADPELEARFEREAKSAGRLHHPNVVCIYDRFQVRGQPYLATEYVDGLDLSLVLEKVRPLPWRLAATIALEVARGLEAIHGHGTLHRDLKPQNLLVGRHGEVKITDFGLAISPSTGAPLTRPGVALGTPPYMPPEQMRADRTDPRADLFSLGVVLYEMLVGEPPFLLPATEDDPPLLERLESGRYPRLRTRRRDVPRALSRIVRDLLRPDPARRTPTATDLRGRLERLLDRPTPAECAHLVARFLWERRVFEAKDSETVVLVSATPPAPRRALRTGLACAALAASAALLVWSLAVPADVLLWTDQVTALLARR